MGESGRWVGNVNAKSIVIAGEVKGEIIAEEKLEVLSTAKITGTICAKTLAIAEGAVHQGEVSMGDVTRYKDRRAQSRE